MILSLYKREAFKYLLLAVFTSIIGYVLEYLCPWFPQTLLLLLPKVREYFVDKFNSNFDPVYNNILIRKQQFDEDRKQYYIQLKFEEESRKLDELHESFDAIFNSVEIDVPENAPFLDMDAVD